MKLCLLLSLSLLCLNSFAQTDIKTYRRAEIDKNNSIHEKSDALINLYNYYWDTPLSKENEKKSYKQLVKLSNKLISDSAFTKLVKKDIAFAVIGSQSPTPGLSLDISDQTSFKITGLIPSKRKIVTLDVTAARAEDNIPLFSDGKFNAQMSTGLSFHIIPSGQWRPFRNNPTITLGNKYSFREEDGQMMRELEKADGKKFDSDLLDTVAVLGCYMKLIQSAGLRSIFLRDIHLEKDLKDQQDQVKQAQAIFDQKEKDNATGQEYLQAKSALRVAERKLKRLKEEESMINKKAFDEILNYYLDSTEDEVISTITDKVREKLFFDLLSTYFPLDDKYDTVTRLRKDLKELKNWNAEKLSADLDKACQNYLHRDEVKEDVQIERSQPLWTRKQLNWFTITAKPTIYTIDSFSNDSTAKPKAIKSSSLSFFEFSVPIWYQFYDIRKKGGNLWRIGATINAASNRTDFKKAKYITRDTLVQYPNNTVITEEQTEGIYDDGTTRRNKLYINYYAEFYRLPRRNFVPGYSIKFSYSRSAIFGTDTDRKLRLELGSVLNILTPDKDKTIFTIQPYIAISNLLYETVEEGDSSRRKKLGEKSSAGIRIGIPIRQQLTIGRQR